jgi:hypothetical protein
MVQIGDVADPASLRIGMPGAARVPAGCWDGEAGDLHGRKAVPA